MNFRRAHRHGKAWEQIGVDDNGEPMYRLGWREWSLIAFTMLTGLAAWVYGIAWMVS